jgi:hypothetical protein
MGVDCGCNAAKRRDAGGLERAHWQMVMVIFFPLLDLLWIASIISISTFRPFAEFLTLNAEEGAQIITAIIGLAIWIP